MKNKLDNTNRIAVITGGGKHLGKEIAIGLANNGFLVVIDYYQSKDNAGKTVNELNKSGKSAVAIKADITKQADLKRLFKTVINKYKRIDLLVNNAGVIKDGAINSTTEKSWNEVIDTNLKGTFFASQSVAKHMLKQGGGQIINIASLGGVKPFIYYIPYSVSKAGVIMMTKCLAKALAPNILVNAIAPGTIKFEKSEKSSMKMRQEKNLLNKYASAQDITDLVVFLATKNKHITGQTFVVDGGSSIL
jgi:3-oxoacyl-[acyl-carrier protein] reductase